MTGPQHKRPKWRRTRAWLARRDQLDVVTVLVAVNVALTAVSVALITVVLAVLGVA